MDEVIVLVRLDISGQIGEDTLYCQILQWIAGFLE